MLEWSRLLYDTVLAESVRPSCRNLRNVGSFNTSLLRVCINMMNVKFVHAEITTFDHDCPSLMGRNWESKYF